ncbi:MAG: cupin domain-containing protein [Verrucomicrobiota bacterium]
MQIIKIDQCPDYIAPDNAIAKEFISPKNSPLENLSIAKITIPPHTSVEKHYHLKSEEVYQIIEGVGEMRLGNETQTVGPGEVVPIYPHTWHSIDNPSDQDLVMIVTCSPPWDANDQVFEPHVNKA